MKKVLGKDLQVGDVITTNSGTVMCLVVGRSAPAPAEWAGLHDAWSLLAAAYGLVNHLITAVKS